MKTNYKFNKNVQILYNMDFKKKMNRKAIKMNFMKIFSFLKKNKIMKNA